MDAIGDAIFRGDAWIWHLSNIVVGVAVFGATLLNAPPGTYSLNLIVLSVDLFYILIPVSILWTCWCGIDFWRWYNSDDIL